jgi:hypothetical protein
MADVAELAAVDPRAWDLGPKDDASVASRTTAFATLFLTLPVACMLAVEIWVHADVNSISNEDFWTAVWLFDADLCLYILLGIGVVLWLLDPEDWPWQAQLGVGSVYWALLFCAGSALAVQLRRTDVPSTLFFMTGLVAAYGMSGQVSDKVFFGHLSKVCYALTAVCAISSATVQIMHYSDDAWELKLADWHFTSEVGPIIGTGFYFVVAQLASMESTTLIHHNPADPVQGGAFTVEEIKGLQQRMTTGIGCVLLVVLLYWVSLQVSAVDSEHGVTSYVMRQALLYGLLTWLFIYRLSKQIGEDGILEALPGWVKKLVESNWLRGLVVMAFLPLLPFRWILIQLRSGVRYVRHRDDGSGSAAWEWTSVLSCAVKLIFIYLLFGVLAQQMLTAVMDFLREKCQGMHTALLCLILFSVGFTLFMLPPTTGQPVYILAGALLAPKLANAKSPTDGGFLGGLALACFVSWAMKLAACAGQQVLIGQQMSKSVRIRYTVGVHTVPIRATEAILRAPTGQMELGKVAILLGCPDWPTGVLCGILNLSLTSTLLRTSPVLFQSVLPTCLFGALTWIVQDEEGQAGDKRYKPYMNATLVFAMVLQAGLGATALRYIMREAKNPVHEEERPEDAPLKRLQALDEAKAKAVQERMRWVELPIWVKAALLLSLILFWTAAAMAKLSTGGKEKTRCRQEQEETGESCARAGGIWATLLASLVKYCTGSDSVNYGQIMAVEDWLSGSYLWFVLGAVVCFTVFDSYQRGLRWEYERQNPLEEPSDAYDGEASSLLKQE